MVKKKCKHFDGGKKRVDLVPPEIVEAMASILEYGCHKYGENDWKKGLDFKKYYASLLRHLFAWKKGEDKDPESGLSHLDHALCNLGFLVFYSKHKKYKEFDKR